MGQLTSGAGVTTEFGCHLTRAVMRCTLLLGVRRGSEEVHLRVKNELKWDGPNPQVYSRVFFLRKDFLLTLIIQY